MKFNLNLVLSGIILLSCLEIQSQSAGLPKLPGGVAGLKHWYSISKSSTQQWQWSDKVSKSEPTIAVAEEEIAYINGNPALKLDVGRVPLNLPMNTTVLDQSTIISLYQVQDTFLEQVIWRIKSVGSTDLVLSTSRLGDVSRGRYFDSPTKNGSYPMLHTYFQHDRSKGVKTNGQWHIGHVGDQQNLPLSPFKGALAELLVFDRVLSAEELSKVHSQLAIQYGISLPSADYLNASGEKVWEFKDNQSFPYRITGLMYDPLSGLHQRRSSTEMSANKLIELSAGTWTSTNAENKAQLPAGAALVWGDNGERLRFKIADEESGRPTMLERKWLMDVGAGGEAVATAVRLHTRNLERLVQAGQEIWLAVDASGAGEFAYSDTKYYAVEQRDGEVLTFEDIRWDEDQSGKDVFTFVLGQPMVPVMAIEQPQCQPIGKGELALRIYGGVAPYQVRWMGEDGIDYKSWQVNAGEELSWSEERTGYFELRLTDAQGSSIRKTVNLQYFDAPAVDLLPQYTLSPTEPLTLSLEDQLTRNKSVLWTRPDGTSQNNFTFSTATPGAYLVQVASNGCARTHRFDVLPPPESFVEEWQLFPNPVGINKDFDLRISLRESQGLELHILDTPGRLLSQEKRAPAAFHTFSHRLSSPGMYQLILHNGKEQLSVPIVVQ